MIKGALGASEGHQVDTRFVLGQKFRNRKQYVQTLETEKQEKNDIQTRNQNRNQNRIWRIMVFDL